MFIDTVNFIAQGGHGGAGAVHFAKRKYQPFGGPDGGDGGQGGSVVLIGSKALETFHDLRIEIQRKEVLRAPNGQPGGENLRIGAAARDFEIAVPLGTIAVDTGTGAELGCVTAGGSKLVLAAGGRGGGGNPKYATGSQRAPKRAGPGQEGDRRHIELVYRIYAHTMLVEPSHPAGAALLPELLKRPADGIDYELYLNRPRWVRVEHLYRDYDIAFLPLLAARSADEQSAEDAELAELIRAEEAAEGTGLDAAPSVPAATAQVAFPHLEHLFWAERIVVNLLPLEPAAQPAAYSELRRQLHSLVLRRAERIVVLAQEQLAEDWQLETETGVADVRCRAADSGACFELFAAELTGGVVL